MEKELYAGDELRIDEDENDDFGDGFEDLYPDDKDDFPEFIESIDDYDDARDLER